eukprot:gb/GFBE01063791.1/.p1 GENE.gb/GFBE01063791.1/~~gb/GFBE01063791.1/.p1  ORF type:complete len:107 (+),score=29.45 gb/GFBE01063791.1/:1-321(+)
MPTYEEACQTVVVHKFCQETAVALDRCLSSRTSAECRPEMQSFEACAKKALPSVSELLNDVSFQQCTAEAAELKRCVKTNGAAAAETKCKAAEESMMGCAVRKIME